MRSNNKTNQNILPEKCGRQNLGPNTNGMIMIITDTKKLKLKHTDSVSVEQMKFRLIAIKLSLGLLYNRELPTPSAVKKVVSYVI